MVCFFFIFRQRYGFDKGVDFFFFVRLRFPGSIWRKCFV